MNSVMITLCPRRQNVLIPTYCLLLLCEKAIVLENRCSIFFQHLPKSVFIGEIKTQQPCLNFQNIQITLISIQNH